MKNPPFTLPLKLGMANGCNANLITDAEDHGVVMVYDIFQHATIDEVRQSERCATGVERADYMINAVNHHAAMYALIEQFGDCVTNMFEQMVKGGWVDDHGHKVVMNKTMMDLRAPVETAITLRAMIVVGAGKKAGAA